MLKSRTEKGKKIKLWLDDGNIKGTIEGIVSDREVKVIKVKGFNCLSFGNAKLNGETTRILTKINNDIEAFLEKTEKEERERPGKVEIKLYEASGWKLDKEYMEIEDKKFSDKQKEMIEVIKNNTNQEALFAGGSKRIMTEDLPVEPGEEYTLEEIFEIITNTEKYQNKKDKQTEKEEKRKEKFKEAEKTGKKVLLNSYITECDGSVIECSTDIIRIYAMPDGSETSERIHTH